MRGLNGSKATSRIYGGFRMKKEWAEYRKKYESNLSVGMDSLREYGVCEVASKRDMKAVGNLQSLEKYLYTKKMY
jgi:hypothetical protein